MVRIRQRDLGTTAVHSNQMQGNSICSHRGGYQQPIPPALTISLSSYLDLVLLELWRLCMLQRHSQRCNLVVVGAALQIVKCEVSIRQKHLRLRLLASGSAAIQSRTEQQLYRLHLQRGEDCEVDLVLVVKFCTLLLAPPEVLLWLWALRCNESSSCMWRSAAHNHPPESILTSNGTAAALMCDLTCSQNAQLAHKRGLGQGKEQPLL
jgi:hypothetical protein